MSQTNLLGPQARALLGAFLRMDLRNQTYAAATGANAKATIPPLYWVLGQFLATSALLSAALFMRVDIGFFALAGLMAQTVLIFSALVVEFHEVVLDPADLTVLGAYPLEPRSYAVARLANLGAYLAVMGLSCAIFPAILGAVQPDAPWFYLPAYLASASVVTVGTAAAVILLYTTLGVGAALDGVRALLAWVQIAAIMVIFYGGQLMLRNADGQVEYFAAYPPGWIAYLPWAPLAAWAGGAAVGWPLGAVVLSSLLVTWAARTQLDRAWNKLLSGQARRAAAFSPVGGTAGPRTTFWLKNPAEAIGYWLVRIYLKRDPELAMRAWPSLGMAGAALALGALTETLGSPFLPPTPNLALTAMVGVLLAAAIPIIYQNLLYSRDFSAQWLLRSAPLAQPEAVLRGAQKAVSVTFILPSLVAGILALGWVWREPGAVLVQVGFWAVGAEAAGYLSQRYLMTDFPLSRPMARGGALGPASLISLTAGGGAAGLGAFQYLLAGEPWHQVGLLLLSGAALLAWAKKTNRAGVLS